jgi:hypothetical protein
MDAANYDTANTGYGFEGHPRRPAAGRYYGDLTPAAEY